MPEANKIEEFLTNNTVRTHYALDVAMYKAHRDDRNEYAESTARALLENDDLPLLLRARACMILGCSIDPDFLEMAEEAVRIAELGFSRCKNPGDTEKQFVRDCHTVLKGAKAAHAEHVENNESEAADDILVWEAPSEDEEVSGPSGGPQGGMATQQK